MNFLAGIFFCFGALDYFCGNRFGIGESFLEGLKSITDLLLLMTGFMILAPWIHARAIHRTCFSSRGV